MVSPRDSRYNPYRPWRWELSAHAHSISPPRSPYYRYSQSRRSLPKVYGRRWRSKGERRRRRCGHGEAREQLAEPAARADELHLPQRGRTRGPLLRRRRCLRRGARRRHASRPRSAAAHAEHARAERRAHPRSFASTSSPRALPTPSIPAAPPSTRSSAASSRSPMASLCA